MSCSLLFSQEKDASLQRDSIIVYTVHCLQGRAIPPFLHTSSWRVA
jgi:hypothetical protein